MILRIILIYKKKIVFCTNVNLVVVTIEIQTMISSESTCNKIVIHK